MACFPSFDIIAGFSANSLSPFTVCYTCLVLIWWNVAVYISNHSSSSSSSSSATECVD